MPSEQNSPSDVSEDDEAMRRLWPDMDREEAAAWTVLPPDRRRRAVIRLSALHAIEGVGRRNLNLADAAEAAGMGVSTFYAMRDRWRSSRRLASLGVYAGPRSNDPIGSQAVRTERVETAELARAVIEDVLRRSPDAGPALVNKELGSRGVPMAPTTMKRLLDEVRRGMPVAAVLGRRLTFDNAGADLVDAAGRRQRLCAALDAEAGMVLGWTLCAEDAVAEGYASAAADALAKLFPDDSSTPRADLTAFWTSDAPFHGGAPSIDLLVAEGQDGAGADWRRLRRLGCVRRTVRIGLEVVKALGERVGRVWIGTGTRGGRSYRSGRPASFPVASAALDRELDDAVHDQNLRRLDLVVRQASVEVDDVHRRDVSLEGMRSALSSISCVVPPRSGSFPPEEVGQRGG